jgi:2-(1,2-epoxy-1,2-dihydrophenyl)acetyl-CoA isomerase
MSETILYDVADNVATITFNRPDKLNAFTDEMLSAFGNTLKQAERDAAIRAVVITGAGRGFSAGQDLASVREREAADGKVSFREHLVATYNPIITRLRRMEKPVLAAVNGVAAGAGASVALACDLRVAAQSATFIQAFIKVGLIPDSGSTFFLPRLVGYPRAFELAITGDRLTAEQALAMGMVTRVVADAELTAAARELAARLAELPTRAIGLTKRAMNRAMLVDIEETLDYEAYLQEIAGRTDDHREGVAAFLEKRPARFVGR